MHGRNDIFVVERNILSDFELQNGGRKAAPPKRLVDIGQQGITTELGREEIDRDAIEQSSTLAPNRRSLTGRAHDPPANVACDCALRKGVNEQTGREDTPLGMAPAKERLGTDHSLVLEADYWLEVKLKLVFCERPPQLDKEPATCLRLRSKGGLEKPINSTAAGFCLIERKVGIDDQLVGIDPVIRGGRDACAGSEMNRVIANPERFGKAFEDCVNDQADAPWVATVRNNDNKFVSALAKRLH